MSSTDASIVIDGKSIEELKVVELRKELEQRNLPKSGNKKELYERLRNYLLNSGEADRLKSASSSPQKEADAASEQAPINPYVKQYLANQQQALAEAKLNAERVRGTPSSDDDVETTGDSPAKEPGGGQNQRSPISITHPPSEPLPPSETAPEKKEESQQPTPPAILSQNSEEHPPEEPKDRVQTRNTLFAGSENQGVNKAGTKEGTSSDEAAEEVIESGEAMPVKDSAEDAPEEPTTTTMVAGEDLDYGEGLDDESQAAEEEVSKDIIAEKITDGGKQTRMERMETVEATKEGDARRSSTRSRFEKGQLPASLPSADDNSITPEGFVRRRDSSPARNPPSQYIAIRGLKRPFTQKQLILMLSTFGTLNEEEFWIDSIKSSCIAKFENDEQAKRARESLHNVVWPPASDSDEDKLARRRAETDKKPVPSSLGPQPTTFGGAAVPAAVGGGLGITITVDNRTSLPSREVDIYHDSIDMRDGVIQASDDANEERLPEPMVLERKRRVSAQSGDSTQRSTPIVQRSLEELFLKTETKPHIYYLPLTEEQAEERAERKRQAAALAPPPASGPSRQQQDSVEKERDRERRDRDRYSGGRDGYHRNSGGGMRRSRSPVERTRYR